MSRSGASCGTAFALSVLSRLREWHMRYLRYNDGLWPNLFALAYLPGGYSGCERPYPLQVVQ